jgi:pyruvate dehydrogenase E2 component (dihydrolipoamide acetyltransferase)
MQQDTGRLVAWLKAAGEAVAKGEPVMEIETDKTTVEIEAPASGILGGVRVQEGDTVPVGQTVAWILAPGESEPVVSQAVEIASQSKTSPEKPQCEEETPATPANSRASVSATPVARRIAEEYGVDLALITVAGGRIEERGVLAYLEAREPAEGAARLPPASPKARRLARLRGLDLKDISGSGPGGAVLAADVPVVGKTLEPSGMWQVMVDRLTASWATTPQFCLVREVNASRLLTWRENAQERTGIKLTYSDLLVKLVATSLTLHPRLNASWREGEIVLHDEINIGLAVAVEDGLVVPVLRRANELALRQIAARRQELVRRAQARRLTPENLSGGTFTISNLGMYGVDMFNAVVNPPQAAILSVGRIAERVVPVSGQPAVQPVVVLSLTCDHRAIDGARAAEFLQTVVRLVEEPMLVLE